VGSRYLTDLADVCRAAGLVVHEVDGWERRARGSGGYDQGRPTHVMVHHTASGPSSDPDGDVAYIATGSADAPLANLYLSRSGEMWVIAAGATNTNGSGQAPWPGGCPDDQMNTHAIGIEAANAGTGEEPWPHVQQTAYVALCAGLCAAYGIGPDLVRAHFEWAPGRKIDPAGQSMYASGSSSWAMDPFRDDVAADQQPEPPTPPPDPEEDHDMAFIIVNRDTGQPALVYGDGRVTGLDGSSFAAFDARFGPAITVEAVTFDDFRTKD
jgi:hypothetical protein